ncbi:hypothetical protein [Allobranchiibius sp. GilTou73]|uniref:hypothetical protein n=1 Tax=Allobranchiibius sp. GilTou73 TaxID=2904523 RepID=UPI001F309A20|nr:hypothetical protein [Allobranchiibius sp. GilTou73]UIJ35435.1 hypothetical protein LVQ62_03320 [Allobranchiibius sp. GilTou73]
MSLTGSPDILTSTTEGVLAGTSGRDGTAGMSLASSTGVTTTVALRPISGYARTARWLQAAVGVPGILAVGGARGGAHGNVRWTVWRAPRTAGGFGTLTETPQTFETFGGLQAGDLVGTAYAGSDALIVGSWVGAHGLDVTTWHPQGSTWLRDPPSPVLNNTASILKSAAAVGALGDRFVVVGDLLDLDHGITSHPVVWLRAADGGSWTEHRIAITGHARAVGCSRQRCVVVGVTAGGAARAWELKGDESITSIELPETVTGESDISTPVVTSDSTTIALPTRSGSLLVQVSRGRTTVLRTPPGSPVALAADRRRIYLATRAGAGPAQLWRVAAQP